MLLVTYPDPDFQVRQEKGKDYIFDDIRKKWLLLTPEEWVRQNFVRFLTRVKTYPSSLVALEKMIRLGELKKRFDILVYDTSLRPWIMIECKAPSVTLDQSVLHQVLRYHITIPAGILVVTNGQNSFAWQKREGQLELIQELPGWNLPG